VKGILIKNNFFGGIMKCDIIAERPGRRGQVKVGLKVPLVVKVRVAPMCAGQEDNRESGSTWCRPDDRGPILSFARWQK